MTEDDILKKVFIGGNHLASYLLSLDISLEKIAPLDFLERYGSERGEYDCYVAWRAIMELRDFYNEIKLATQTHATRSPNVEYKLVSINGVKIDNEKES